MHPVSTSNYRKKLSAFVAGSSEVLGARTVRVTTAAPWVGVCPVWATISTRPKGWVFTRRRGIKIGPDRPAANGISENSCASTCPETESFTKSTPQIPHVAIDMVRTIDVEWISRRRPLRTAERLTEKQRSAVFQKLAGANPTGTSMPCG